MNYEEALEEIFANWESDLSKERKQESEWNVLKSGENNSEPEENRIKTNDLTKVTEL